MYVLYVLYVYIFVSNKLCNVCDVLRVTLTKIFSQHSMILNESMSVCSWISICSDAFLSKYCHKISMIPR